MQGIVLTRNGIYLHGEKKVKVGGSITQSNDTIRKMTSQVNNASTGIMGLGTQTSVLAKLALQPTGTTLGKLATHDVLKTTHLTKTAPIFTFSLPCNSVLSNGAYFVFLLP